MKSISPADVPSFATVAEFADWYVSAGSPTLFPEKSKHEVFVTDDATASCLFRHGRFQVEMYLIHPNPVIPVHEHPGVQNIEIGQQEWDSLCRADLERHVQGPGQSHGIGFRTRASHKGFVLFSAQMWDEGLEVTTIGARWKGHTAGPKHEALIRRFNPGCLVYPGYADVTLRQPVVAVL